MPLHSATSPVPQFPPQRRALQAPHPPLAKDAHEPHCPSFCWDTVIIVIIPIIIIIIIVMLGGASAALPDPSLESEASFKGKELCHRPTAAAFSSIRRGNEAIYGHLQSDV